MHTRNLLAIELGARILPNRLLASLLINGNV
jgi:hypothetical protein